VQAANISWRCTESYASVSEFGAAVEHRARATLDRAEGPTNAV
jgi:hypothetical protein